MSEQLLQTKCINYAKKKGAYIVKVVSATKSGVPDVILCLYSKFYAFEFKSERGTVSKLQQVNIDKIHKAKGMAWVIDNFVTFKRIIDYIQSEQTVISMAIEHFGEQSQVNKSQEELAELIQALNKYRMYRSNKTLADLLEEIVDVEIMIKQLKKMYVEANIEKYNTIRATKYYKLKERLKQKSRS
jgi:NTP pyrophosphatase (non-canonical NTP hydrolase)